MNRSRARILAALLLLWTARLAAQIASAGDATIPVSPIEVSSTAVGSSEAPRRMRAEGYPWEHEIQVALPASYRSTHKLYPVLWVTDGQYNFGTAVKTVNDLQRTYLPEMIVVGIGVPPESLKEAQMRRVYDFSLPGMRGFEGFGSRLFDAQTKIFEESLKSAGIAPGDRRGGAPAFLRFLVNQVRPALAKEYRMSGDNTLYGHSGGGLFCTYVLLAQPKAFTRYLCTSPNLYAGNYALFRIEERYAETHTDLPATVFFGAGEGEVLEGGWISAWGTVSSMTRMAEILRLRPYPSLKLYLRIFPNAGHSTNSVSLQGGLRTLWKPEASGTRH